MLKSRDFLQMMSVDVGKTHDSEGYGYREARGMAADFPQDAMWRLILGIFEWRVHEILISCFL